ncbi:MarR family winged helix-turn-helix transcriptional regulator [Novosphingobium sp. KACC 22771]|uniref:MarR family winged helix-turn-helix transcriptional regulator n=1 Tax=Novosphingobium sp. KACC 22771 TaxID=3025670 RepID=UPI0023665780|nr:MarR family transcriptional regulator [Novosphingobium sp. KACC 22771]WDF72201.1 MarR family transcriptional regulator [Novosphingobium sp. KACC 22771]
MNDPLANLPGYVLRRASSAALAGLNRRLSALSLRHVDASLLMLLNGQPGITQSEAGRVLDIQRANMVPIVGRLEARGLIDRQRVDGRSQGLYLSAEGEALHTQVMGVIDGYEQTLMEGVPAPLRKQAMAVLHAFWQSAEAAIESD